MRTKKKHLYFSQALFSIHFCPEKKVSIFNNGRLVFKLDLIAKHTLRFSLNALKLLVRKYADDFKANKTSFHSKLHLCYCHVAR